MNVQELGQKIASRRRELDALNGQSESVIRRLSEVEKEIKQLQDEILVLDKTSIVLNSLGESRQLKAQTTIEELVTRGLREIFDDSLSFHIVQQTKAKTTTVEFLVRTSLEGGGFVDTPVMDARGGGLAATIGFLLRVVILLLKNDSAKIMILDETFAHVSSEYLPALSSFLRELVDKAGIQLIMVTHQEELVEDADKVYRFHTENGVTKVSEV